MGVPGVGNYLPRDFAVDLRRTHAAPRHRSTFVGGDRHPSARKAGAARAPIDVPVSEADPYGLDLQLALYTCYELHYRGFAGVNPRWEWNPALLHVRGRLEEAFLSAVRHDVGEIGPDETAADAMDALSVEAVDGTGPSYYLRDTGTWGQMREYFVHRSLYHLKEADPHAFAIPRLIGQAKASFVAVEFDEYGGGRGALVHQQLFADLMDAAGLDSDLPRAISTTCRPTRWRRST